ncbi:uncharacterized protein B0H18DRAFT_1116248 [Fomitopsis serialis]|uniref:uncharacterized protein n=1 Tax=Fomitopsis serialis TaxID=139415 RepID=UPI00200741CB|nr:uncharacterized protein B0H18DRAFT_1116248 [Neoantrodia serialis]KAH9931434.1 hypothetical protein B0H18DRAFT_1116248 [Neoantrodia serialis]
MPLTVTAFFGVPSSLCIPLRSVQPTGNLNGGPVPLLPVFLGVSRSILRYPPLRTDCMQAWRIDEPQSSPLAKSSLQESYIGITLQRQVSEYAVCDIVRARERLWGIPDRLES